MNAPVPHTRRFFYRLTYTAAFMGFVARVGEAFGREGCGFVADVVSRFYTATNPAIVEVVRSNLALLAPEMATTRNADRVFQNFARDMADYLAVGGMSPREASTLCVERHGLDHLMEVRKSGRGAVLATGHFGFFEFGSLLLAELGIPVTVLTLGEPSDELTAWRAAYRRRWGANTIEIGADAFSSLQVIRELEQGRFCALLVDRPVHGATVPVELPGGAIPFSTSAALLAYLARCPLLPVNVQRRPDGMFRMHAGAPVECPTGVAREQALEDATRQIGKALAGEFALSPLQWYHFVPLKP